ncbi:50S ribosomal protein L3 [Candidatus Pacearchaeota archaeon ex4484_31]|nr:MAG: 50S ribosomal protein L3 [Candidatus Pacearchaeota archaeon ex4484_31]
MAKRSKPRAGSLQFWPRKRAKKLLPRVNWKALEERNKTKGILGFICYKAGMARVLARDLTEKSLTKGQEIVLPTTFVECPPMRILSVRFYKNGKTALDVLLPVPEKDKKLVKRKVKLPKKEISFDEFCKLEQRLDEFDDIRIIVYSLVRLTKKRKTPPIAEIGLAGNIKEKFEFVKEHFNKEIDISEFNPSLVDARGVTKGKGYAGPVKRFGIKLKQHKSEKGRRRPGTLGPWTPSRVTFRVPMAGQLGFFTRINYNLKVLRSGNGTEINFEFPHYGKIRTKYLAIKGSLQGPPKRELLLTIPLRATKKAEKQNFEIVRFLK